MNGNEITVGIVLSLIIVLAICGFWIWVFNRMRRRGPGLRAPDRSCNRDWYSPGGGK
jgi:flagellar biogenesis protein FliO